MERTAIHSSSYEEKLKNLPKLTKEAKQARLQAIVADKQSAMRRIGQGMIGPIQIRLRYEGIVRNVLVEDTLERGPLMPYDILDDLGIAYVLNTIEGEVQAVPFEGKQAFPALFRIATFPRIKKEDLYLLRVNVVEYAQDESRQAIQKQEDCRLVILLEDAISNLGTIRGTTVGASNTVGAQQTGGVPVGIAAGPQGAVNEQTVVIGAGTALEPADFYNAVTMIEINQLEANRVLAHPADIRDLYTWDINVTGFRFKDEVFAGGKITTFGEFQIQKSIMIPQGEIFLAADPEFVGVFPVMYSLDVEENHLIQQFLKGWVFDEMVGLMILNPRGLARVIKATGVPYSGFQYGYPVPADQQVASYIAGGTDL
jgi:hypothetical protein